MFDVVRMIHALMVVGIVLVMIMMVAAWAGCGGDRWWLNGSDVNEYGVGDDGGGSCGGDGYCKRKMKEEKREMRGNHPFKFSSVNFWNLIQALLYSPLVKSGLDIMGYS